MNNLIQLVISYIIYIVYDKKIELKEDYGFVVLKRGGKKTLVEIGTNNHKKLIKEGWKYVNFKSNIHTIPINKKKTAIIKQI